MRVADVTRGGYCCVMAIICAYDMSKRWIGLWRRWWMSSHGSCLEETRRTMYERWENESIVNIYYSNSRIHKAII